MKVTEDVAGHCPPLAGGRGVERHKQESWHTYNLNIYVFVQTIARYAMNGESAVGFKMKIRIHNEGVVEAVKKSSPPPAPPSAGDM